MFYSNKSAQYAYNRYGWEETLDFVKSDRWLDYDYLAFRIKRKNQKGADFLVKSLGKDPIKTFRNKKGDKVLIFKVH